MFHYAAASQFRGVSFPNGFCFPFLFKYQSEFLVFGWLRLDYTASDRLFNPSQLCQTVYLLSVSIFDNATAPEKALPECEFLFYSVPYAQLAPPLS